MKRSLTLLLSALTVPLLSTVALACPEVDGIPDFNCDGSLNITVLGDSFVTGIGDRPQRVKKGNGGYVGRISRSFPNVQFQNEGEPGLMARRLLRRVSKSITGNGSQPLYATLRVSDVVVLDLGRNDRWLFKEPKETYGKLVRICSKIVDHFEEVDGLAPLCVTSVMMLPNRGSQGPWVADLNKLILSGDRLNRPADLRFDTVSKRLLQDDQIHPSPQGYKELTKVFKTYLRRKLPRKLRTLRPDSDRDSIPDIIEQVKFGTDPSQSDTDGDGPSDGAEVFLLGSDPLLAGALP